LALAAGAYAYRAVVAGNDNYIGGTSGCEPITVDKGTPNITTVIHDSSHNPVGPQVLVDTVHDKATVTGDPFTPGGNVTFTFYNNNTCYGEGVGAGTVGLSGGIADPSNSEGPLGAGLYSFKAHYNGDSNYVENNSDCEPFSISKITIIKDASPNDCQDFTFTGGLGTFSLDDDADVADCPGTDQPQSITSILAANNSYTVTEGTLNAYWTLKNITCTGASDYTTNTSTRNVTINLKPGEDVTCTFVNEKQSPTRTLGFWQTHTAYTSSIFSTYFSGGMQIGSAPHKGVITNILSAGQSQLFGAFYAPIAKTTTGAKRTPLEQARIQLLQQLVAAKLNCAAFGCQASVQTLIANADTAYANDNKTNILISAGLLDNYNNSGDTIIIGNVGKATPQLSKGYANLIFWNQP